MSPNVPDKALDPRRERAAVLVAEDRLNDQEIAEAVGLKSRKSITRWRQEPAFQARVAEHAAELEAAVSRLAIAKKRERVKRLDRDWRKLQALIEARGRELDGQVAGGETGLLVHQVRAIGAGRTQQIIDEYVLDAALLKELRAHEEQAAKELKQWSEKTEVSGPDGGPIEVMQTGLSDEQRAERVAALLDRIRARVVGSPGDGPGQLVSAPRPPD